MAKSALANYIYEYTDEGEPNADTDDDDDEEIDAEELLFTDHPLVGSDPPDNEDDGDPDEETDDDDINAILGDLSEVGKLIKTNPKQGKKRAIRLASDDLNDGEYYAKPLAKAKADLAKADTALRDERALSKGLSFSLTEVLDCFDEEFILERFSPEIVKFYKEIYPILIVAVHKNVTKRRNAKIKEHNERVARYNELAAELGQKQLPLIKK